jgi:hypothetical protein
LGGEVLASPKDEFQKNKTFIAEVAMVVFLVWLPSAAYAIQLFLAGQRVDPRFLASAYTLLNASSIIFLLIYLIFRSGKPFEMFGLRKPRASDLLHGLVLLGAMATKPMGLLAPEPRHATRTSDFPGSALVTFRTYDG